MKLNFTGNDEMEIGNPPPGGKINSSKKRP